MASEEELEAAFRGELGAYAVGNVQAEVAAALVDAYARGRTAYPELNVEATTFARHVARAVARMPDCTNVQALVPEDLYLACACVTRVSGAADVFVARLRPLITRVIRTICPKATAEEITQSLLADLLVGAAASAPVLGEYAGRAPLARWLEVVAHRAALQWLRSERAKADLLIRAAAEPSAGGHRPAELVLSQERHADDFTKALEEALRRAPQGDRAILRLHLLDNVSVERIGKMLGVSQASASRRLAKARERILFDLKAVLGRRLGISSSEVASLANLLASRLDLSLSQVLKTSS